MKKLSRQRFGVVGIFVISCTAYRAAATADGRMPRRAMAADTDKDTDKDKDTDIERGEKDKEIILAPPPTHTDLFKKF